MVFPALAAGALIGGSILSSKAQSDAAKRAANAQVQASEAGIEERKEALERQLGITQPFREAGESVILPLFRALGLEQGQDFQPSGAQGLPGREILDNPLLKAIQDDVTERVFSNRAARGILGSGGTPDALFSSLAPTALNFGLQLQDREQFQRQQQIQNLFNLLGLGANAATGQGTAIQQTGQGVSGLLQNQGLARAGGALGRGNAISSGINDIAGLGLLSSGGFFNSPVQASSGFTGDIFTPTAIGNIA